MEKKSEGISLMKTGREGISPKETKSEGSLYQTGSEGIPLTQEIKISLHWTKAESEGISPTEKKSEGIPLMKAEREGDSLSEVGISPCET